MQRQESFPQAEYAGKKIEAREVKMAMLAILILPLMYLGWTAVAVVLPSLARAVGVRRYNRALRRAGVSW